MCNKNQCWTLKKNKGEKVNPNRIRRLRRKNVENPKKGVSQKSIYQET